MTPCYGKRYRSERTSEVKKGPWTFETKKRKKYCDMDSILFTRIVELIAADYLHQHSQDLGPPKDLQTL